MNLKFANFVAMLGIAVSWILLIVVAGVVNNRAGIGGAELIGMVMYALWACSLAGIVIGIVSLAKEVKGWLGWLALIGHGLTLAGSVVFALIGMMLATQQGLL